MLVSDISHVKYLSCAVAMVDFSNCEHFVMCVYLCVVVDCGVFSCATRSGVSYKWVHCHKQNNTS